MRERLKFSRGIRSSAFKRPSIIDVQADWSVDDAVDEAARIAAALIVRTTGPQAHFASAARNFVCAILLDTSTKED